MLLQVCCSFFQVVRCFEDNDIVHVNGKVDPKSDVDVINLELVFSDLDQVSYVELIVLSCCFYESFGFLFRSSGYFLLYILVLSGLLRGFYTEKRA